MNEFRLDLRSIDLLEEKQNGILQQDIKMILGIENTEFHRFPPIEFPNLPKEAEYAIGYINRVKFLHIAYRISKSVNFDIEILQVGIPDEEEITKYWCRRKCEI